MAAVLYNSALTFLLLLVVVNARSANHGGSWSKYVEKMDDYSPIRYHEVRYSDGQLDDSFRTEGKSAVVRSGMTQAQLQEALDHHNKLRAGEGASNMEVLRWNTHLAFMAQRWSDRCQFEHGQPDYDENLHGHKQLGQNIWANTDPLKTITDGVQAWYDEKSDYNYDGDSCNPGKMCGHYTQVAWAKTREVGCGWTNCSSISGMNYANYLVCNYGPAGNWYGQKPFKKGAAACTECDSGKFFCTNGLCDYNCDSAGSDSCQCKASCGNCGSATDDCQCTCKPGWGGVNCDEECKDNDSKCGANPGYPASWCDANHQFVLDGCPKMCGLCEAANGQSCSKKSGNKRADLLDLLEKIRGQLHDAELDEDK